VDTDIVLFTTHSDIQIVIDVSMPGSTIRYMIMPINIQELVKVIERVADIHCGEVDMSTSFIAIKCAAIPFTIFETDLFSLQDLAKGGGMFFLDVITEMPIHLQAKFNAEKECYREAGVKKYKDYLRFITK
jgi:DNA-binding NtrC family response regulator